MGSIGRISPVAFKLGAMGKDRLRGALGQNPVLMLRGLHDDRHHLARKIKRDFVHLHVIDDAQFLLRLRMAQHRAIQHVFQSGLEMADEVGIQQHGVALVFEHVAMEFQDDVIAGERAGLVRAKDIHGAEVLDGIEAFDDDFFLGHGQRALGQADGDDHRQHFRRQTHRHRQGKQKRPGPIMLGAFLQFRRVSVLQQQPVEPEIMAARFFRRDWVSGPKGTFWKRFSS